MDEIDFDAPTPVWRQVYDLLRGRIERGEIVAGRAIPSKRTISEELGVAGNTVEHAIQMLKDDGLVQGVQGRGVFVSLRQDEAPEG